VWNDLWFPLILAPGESTKTVTLGVQVFLGQFVSDWQAILAALTLAAIPILLLYIIFSKQMLSGITQGAIK
jgi:raffinose/stachyose/melibiose transport system permease protein